VKSDNDSLIAEYVDALRHANEDTRGTGPTVLDHAGIPCTPHMARLNNAEHALLTLADRPDLPEPLAAFIAASADRDCPICWLSSRRAVNHPDCQTKTARYFSARHALKLYGEGLAGTSRQRR